MSAQSDAELREIIGLNPIAVVGCSRTPGKAAHDVPRYMHENGYDVIPVNPHAEEIFGRRPYDSVANVETEIGMLNVFRPSEEVERIVDQVLARDDVDAVWTQRGIRDDDAARRVEDSGRTMVQDRCLKVQHRRLVG
ncbi:CoA-binding protein [Halobacteriales archaeon QS_8_69_26]|nr:MAG: CoA-binding protein [Halobacteriales archaeon QS_8_69_26]